MPMGSWRKARVELEEKVGGLSAAPFVREQLGRQPWVKEGKLSPVGDDLDIVGERLGVVMATPPSPPGERGSVAIDELLVHPLQLVQVPP
jgi:hypothetical protein